MQLLLRKKPTQLLIVIISLLPQIKVYKSACLSWAQLSESSVYLWVVICYLLELLFDILLATQKGNRANNVLMLKCNSGITFWYVYLSGCAHVCLFTRKPLQ